MLSSAKSYVDVQSPIVNQNGYLGGSKIMAAGAHDLIGAEYLTNACADGATWEDWCYAVDQKFCDPLDPVIVAPAGGYKVFGKPELVEGSPFVVYDGVDCELNDLADSGRMAVDRLSFSEVRQVDYSMIALLDTMVSLDLGNTTVAPALELMEDNASALYGGYGVISMPRSLLVQAAANRLVFPSPDGGHQTATGTKVLATAQADPVGNRSIYLTGQVTLIQGQVQSHSVPSTSYRGEVDCAPMRALAERMYVPLIECMVVKATVLP